MQTEAAAPSWMQPVKPLTSKVPLCQCLRIKGTYH